MRFSNTIITYGALCLVSLLLSACGGGGGTPAAPPAATYSVLHSFGVAPDGAGPWAGLVLDASGNLYGTTYSGGASGKGTVFRIVP